MARLRQKNKIGTSVETFFHQSMKIKIILTPVLKKMGLRLFPMIISFVKRLKQEGKTHTSFSNS